MTGPAPGSLPHPGVRQGPPGRPAAWLRRAASLTLVLGAVAQAGCAMPSGGSSGLRPPSPKIAFDLSAIAPSGLAGRADGLVAVDYEFCIADDATAEAAVRRIDLTARCMRSRGRIGCSRGQLLCIGHTHRPGWRAVLEELAAREDIRRIERHFAE